MTVIYIVVALLIFGIIIMVHELGHFLVAKACGVKVNEFAIGMGPKIVGWTKGETTYAWRLLPIGGYVSMDGEDTDSDDPRAFGNKKVWQKLLVILAGAIMNLILGFIILIIATSFSDAIITTQIAKFETETASSHMSGLEVGDEIIKVNGSRVFTDSDISYQFQTDEDMTFEMVVIRNGEKVTLPAVKFDSTVLEDGTQALHIDFFVVGDDVNFITVVDYSARKFVSVSKMIIQSLVDLIRGKFGINDLSGPVGIVGAIGDVVGSTEQGVAFGDMLLNLMNFVVFITINVGIFNLLPVPALDGARALFRVFEGITRKKVPATVEGTIHMVGMALLLILVLVVTVSDIIKIF